MLRFPYFNLLDHGPTIPTEPPRPRFLLEVPGKGFPCRAIAGRDSVAVVTGCWTPREGQLLVFDATTGALRFTHDAEPGRYQGFAAFTPGGDVLFATIGSDVAIHRLDGHGKLVGVDRFRLRALPPEPFVSAEVSVVGLEVVDEDRCLVSLFEDDEPFGSYTTLRARGTEQWMIRGSFDGRAGDRVFGHVWLRLDVIAEQRPLECRALDTGEVLWSRTPPDHEHEGVCGSTGGLAIVNSSARAAAIAMKRPVLPPALLMSIDATSGRTRWSHALDAFPLSVMASPNAVAIILDRGDQPGTWMCFDADGGLLRAGSFSAVLEKMNHGERPFVAAVDGAHVLLWERGLLRCEELTPAGRTVWEVPLPGDPPEVMLMDGAICARNGRQLTVLG
ncbi:Hypothetical protein A7982_01755 [Minicystis rosea]|nr:Hypothetical protein A7982_01755 [Minicystis rosea]